MREGDKVIKILLFIIAILLLIITLQLSFGVPVASNAIALSRTNQPDKVVFKIEAIGQIQAEGIKDIKLLSDQRTFIIQLRDNAIIYRIVKEESD